jgi:hypothetical protein
MPGIAGTTLGKVLRHLPAILYTATLATTVFKIQMPQAALLHWLAASSFTIGFQVDYCWRKQLWAGLPTRRCQPVADDVVTLPPSAPCCHLPDGGLLLDAPTAGAADAKAGAEVPAGQRSHRCCRNCRRC